MSVILFATMHERFNEQGISKFHMNKEINI